MRIVGLYPTQHCNMTYKLIEKIAEDKKELVIPFSKYLLNNGLTVILHEDKHDPLVHVDLTYHVGSGREEVGKSGFAHFFEHMMFEGSKHVGNNDHFKFIAEAGGTLNGSTNRDRTNYYETLPKNQLELALWLESDRMGFLLEAVTQEGFENQRSVIKNEKAQRYENQPYGMMSQVNQEHLYPQNHPYSWTTIGYTEDLDRVTTDDLKEFFATWYGPNNAVLTIGGDLVAEEVIELVDKYFGNIPRGPEIPKTDYKPFSLEKTKYISYQDKVRFPMLEITWPTVPMYHPDEAALDVLGDLLGNGKNAMLYSEFVKTQKAVQVFGSHYCYEGAGEFRLGVFAYPNQHMAGVEASIKSILDGIAKEGIKTEEVERARVKYYSQILYALESVKNKVSRLAAYETFAPTADFVEQDASRYKKVAVEDVMRVFHKYIYQKDCINLSFYDAPHKELLPAADNSVYERTGLENIRHASGTVAALDIKENFDRSLKPEGGPSPTVTIPHLYESSFANGLKLMGTTNNESPTMSMELNFHGGSITDPMGESGRAAIYSRMVRESSLHLSAEEMSARLESLGSSISANSHKEDFSISVKCLTENFLDTMELLKEVVFYPAFKEEELDRVKAEQKELLAFQNDETDVLANRAFYEAVYGKEHPIGRPGSGRIEDTDNINLESLLSFQHGIINPENCMIAVSGDLDQDSLENGIDFLISDWDKGETQSQEMPAPAFEGKGQILVSHKEGAAQSEIRIGYPAMPYSATGDFYKSVIMNYPLGTAFNSRINLNLREDKGYTYGARSYFFGGKYNGPYIATAAVGVDVTAQAVKEFAYEIRNYRDNGITNEELEFTKSSILRRDALKYETNSQKVSLMLKMLRFGLVKDFVESQKEILANIAPSELNALAKQHLPLEEMVIVVAGDKNKIVEPLKALNLGKVVVLESSQGIKA